MPATAKTKLSVSLAAQLVRQLDRSVEAKRYRSRSAAIETALRAWAARDRRLQSDAAIEAYYGGLTSGERDEDKIWADFATREFVHLADRDPITAPRPRRRSARSRR